MISIFIEYNETLHSLEVDFLHISVHHATKLAVIVEIFQLQTTVCINIKYISDEGGEGVEDLTFKKSVWLTLTSHFFLSRFGICVSRCVDDLFVVTKAFTHC